MLKNDENRAPALSELLARAVSWTKFPPVGIRGYGLTALHLDHFLTLVAHMRGRDLWSGVGAPGFDLPAVIRQERARRHTGKLGEPRAGEPILPSLMRCESRDFLLFAPHG